MIDFTKPVQTRDGRAAKVIATDIPAGALPESLGDIPVHREDTVMALVTEESGATVLRTFKANGRYLRVMDTEDDLINVPETSKNTVSYHAVILHDLDKHGGQAIISATSFDTPEAARRHFWNTGIVVEVTTDADGEHVSTRLVP